MSDADASAPDDYYGTSVPALWAAARRFLRWLVGMYGTPCALVAGHWLSLKERREILHWLHPVEDLVRRLLVIEAVRLAQTPLPEKKPAPGRRKRPVKARFCRVSFPDPENSQAWSVRFRMIPPARRRGPRFSPRIRLLGRDRDARILAPAALAADAEEHRLRMRSPEEIPAHIRARRPKRSRRAGNPWRLAKRLEALARVLNNPEPHARRLARLLRKDAAPLFRACRPPPLPPPGDPPRPAESSLRYASERALAALETFDPG
ncbi:MAG: hypothetical protein ACLFWF_06225 [Alphaproteobacteria bacterium]